MSKADVIVIGGGIAGVSAAAELAADASVLLLEAEPQVGYHSTGRSAAVFIRNYGNATLRQLNAAAAPLLEAPEGVSDRSLLSPRGELIIATDVELPALDEYADGATGLERLTAHEAQELVPILRADRIAAAVIEWDAQDIDVNRMLSGYMRLLKRRGGRVVTGARVEWIEKSGPAWQVRAGGNLYEGACVVNAAGAWSGIVGEMAGAVDPKLQPLRRSAAILPAPAGHDPRRWPVVANAAESWYAKPEAGKLMVSPADEDPVEPQDAWVDDMVLAEGLHRFEQAVTVTVDRVEHSWAGLRTFAPDRTPVVGYDPHTDGFFWLAGQGGYGVQTAPAMARLTADLVTGRVASIDPACLAALSPARFVA
ncbi:NAD(P)/FAD-dependent oxidoreductase [Lutimaribacter marinistellae]|uniref:NAD(P)/FAD-dependent oxidoreductase n=1 Tax=Lutimaribacter marinistellae TaxID=1820329 RepID=A0ABV7TLF3_9RHOB